MSTLHLACATDARYAVHAAALIHSACSNGAAGAALVVHCLHDDSLGDADRGRLAAVAQAGGATLEFHRLDAALLAQLPKIDRFPALVWGRALLPELLPEVERVLYLDADTIVMQPLRALFDTPLGDAYLGAIDNVLEPHYRSRPAALGMPAEQGYFNSGVLLLSLAAMRADGAGRRVLDYAQQHRTELVWPDQDALNKILGGRRVKLHPRWNAMNSLYVEPWSTWAKAVFGAQAAREAIAAPAILHFEGPGYAKPWHYLCQHPHRDAYLRHVAATPWRKPPLEGRTVGNMVRRRLPQHWVQAAERAVLKARRAARRVL